MLRAFVSRGLLEGFEAREISGWISYPFFNIVSCPPFASPLCL